MQAIENWAQSNGITGDVKALCENPKVKEYILGQIKSFAKEKKVFYFFLNSYWPSVITLVAMMDHQKRHKHTQSQLALEEKKKYFILVKIYGRSPFVSRIW